MARPLPYPGHSWSFTQHSVGLDPGTLYGFLKCAAPFEGEVEGYDDRITDLMIASGILTANRRDGAADAWRDYQQLLAELGLIYSTKICRALTISEVGHMFLAGEIGFAELVGVQALRFQYPNGQKSTVQKRLREALRAESVTPPATLIELQTDRQILLRPGTLVLRVLLELAAAGMAPAISVSECQAFLIPCRTNGEWPACVGEIRAHRASPTDLDHVNRHSRRNIQDWFRLLSKSDYFREYESDQIGLSDLALANLQEIRAYCATLEGAESFWIAPGVDIQSRMTWFNWFGHVPFQAQMILRNDLSDDPEYTTDNYVAGIEEEDEDASSWARGSGGLNLRPVDLEHLGRMTPYEPSRDIDSLVEGLRRGAQKRHAKTLLHDRIVKELAESFIAQRATVVSDPDSVDLLATWPSGDSAVFEVKTVTRRSLQVRLRTAIGQIQEYAYRRRSDGGGVTDRVIVVNTELDETAWQKTFLTDYLDIGLICKPSLSYQAFAPSSSKTQQFWLTRT